MSTTSLAPLHLKNGIPSKVFATVLPFVAVSTIVSCSKNLDFLRFCMAQNTVYKHSTIREL